MKILCALEEVVPVDDVEICAGCLVASSLDPCSTGMVVQVVSDKEVVVLWSIAPKNLHKKFEEIW